MVGYNRRSDPAVMYAKAEIERLKETQELGPLTYIRILMPGGDWIAGGFSDLIRSEQKVKDLDLERDPPASDLNWCAFRWYQMMIDYYIHPINLMRHMLGEPYALTYVSPSRGIMAGSSDSGVACLIEMTPFHTTIDWQETVLVCFKRGWIKIEIPASLAVNKPGRITLYRDPGGGIIPQTIEPQLPWIGSMRQQAINFIRAVKGEIEPLCNAAEAFEDLKIAREYIRMRMEQMDLEE
jgi:predicted dehydrogenase